MGVSLNIYTIYGVKIEYNTELSSDHDFDDDHDFDIIFIFDSIFDSMGVDYIIIGKILFDSGDERHDWEDGDDFKEINIDQITNLKESILNSFKEKYPKHINLIQNEEFKLFTFKHYS